jgi:hypothetical protein
MLYDIIKAEYIDNLKIKIEFEDGKSGIVDFMEYSTQGGVFSRLKDKKYFKRFYLNEELGTICWPYGVDIAPESLYQKI